MTFICNARFHQGSDVTETAGIGAETRQSAFLNAVFAQPVGLRPNDENREAGLRLLNRYTSGDVGAIGVKSLKDGHVTLEVDIDGSPALYIGWVTYTWTARPKLWAITAQVHVRLSSGWESSRQVPTFYLDPSVQGTLDRHAAIRVAHDILSTAGPVDDQEVTLQVSAEPIY